MINALAAVPQAERKRLHRTTQPAWIEPMLATLTDERFSSRGWLYEPKLDGFRCLTFIKGGTVRVMSRNNKPFNEHYPELVGALVRQELADCILDGELLSHAGGTRSFLQFQARISASASGGGLPEVHYYLFDIPYLDGYSLEELPLTTRKAVLKAFVDFSAPLRFTPHRITKGEQYYNDACAKGWEGLVVKRADSPYVRGRSRDWLKFKCVQEQEFVIGGYTDPRGRRAGFGALLVGYFDEDGLQYAGRVGTGYDDRALESLYARLSSIERKKSPFAQDMMPRLGVHWVEPEMVAEVGFAEWTRTGHLRHARFRGLRFDKDAREVVRETADDLS